MPMASRFRAVSMNASPFDRLLPEAEKSITSAPSRLAANEKLVRVRVEFSKNKFTIVRPASTESFCRHPPVASLKRLAVSRSKHISSGESRSRSSRCRWDHPGGTVSGSKCVWDMRENEGGKQSRSRFAGPILASLPILPEKFCPAYQFEPQTYLLPLP